MRILERVPLAAWTTFRTGGAARFWTSATNPHDLREAVRFATQRQAPVLVLGGGSNLLVADCGFEGLVIRNQIEGIEECEVGTDEVQILVGAGVGWDELVQWTVNRGYWGLENLSWIPGTVGAAPVQNIGAYGTEVESVIPWVEVFDPTTDQCHRLDHGACEFGYRHSFFKRPAGQNLIITRVAFKLARRESRNLSYRELANYFAGIDHPPSVAQVRQAVIEIRQRKLPEVGQYGTAGSFFKNPVVARDALERLSADFGPPPSYPTTDGRVKIPAAWLIDHVCGLRAARQGAVGTFATQALAIVNYGGATSDDIFQFSQMIRAAVHDKTRIKLEREVQLVGDFPSSCQPFD